MLFFIDIPHLNFFKCANALIKDGLCLLNAELYNAQFNCKAIRD